MAGLPRTLDTGEPYISVSQAREALSCGRRYKHKYIDGGDHPEDLGLHVGRLVHELIETHLRAAMEDCDPPDAYDQACAYIHDEIPNELLLEDDRDVEDLAERCLDLADVFLDPFIVQGWTPLDVERETVHRKDGYAVKGYLDILAESPDGATVLLDVKTAGRTPSGGRVREGHAMQVLTYVDALGADKVDQASVWYVVKNKTPKLVRTSVPVSDDAFDWAETILDGAVETIRTEQFHPSPFGAGWKCSPDVCGAWGSCPGAARWREDDGGDD
jgi:hypothetical protein